MAVGAGRFCNGEHALDGDPWSPYEVDRRSGECRRKPLDARSAGPIVVGIIGGGLCPAVDVVYLICLLLQRHFRFDIIVSSLSLHR
jgi:hypothetical protein